MDYKNGTTAELVEAFKREDIAAEGVYIEIELLKEIAARPDAVSELRKQLDDPKYWEDEWTYSEFYTDAMYLLGIIKTKESFELIKEMLVKHTEELHDADFITEELAAVLTNFGEGYFDQLEYMTKNVEYDEYIRTAAYDSLCAIAFLNSGFKKQLIEISKTLFEDRYVSDDFPLQVLQDMADLKDNELFDKVITFAKLRDTGEYWFTDIEHLENIYNSMTEEPECLRHIKYIWNNFVSKKENALYRKTHPLEDDEDEDDFDEEGDDEDEDAIRETNWTNKTYWMDKGKKIEVGRNDPCPCGSGQKYKKCHGKPA